jgi:aspartyl-tRNA synthetase
MSFVTQDDVFGAIEPVLAGVFKEFSGWTVSPPPFTRIAYDDAMAMYGSDKPDLRNPIKAVDVTEIFRGSEFAVFAKAVEEGLCPRDQGAGRRREITHSFFDKTVGLLETLGLGRPAPSSRRDAKGRWRSICRGSAEIFDAADVKQGRRGVLRLGPQKTLMRAVDGPRPSQGARVFRAERVSLLLDHRLSVSSSAIRDEPVAFSHNLFSMPQGG